MYVYVRVVKYPKKPRKVFAQSILEHKRIVIVCTLNVLTGRGRVRELLAEIWRLSDEEVSMYSEQVVFNLE